MASAKLGTLIIRTLAKPISTQIKHQAKQHERFRGMCVDLAQWMYRIEVRMRTNLLGGPAVNIRPLSETRAIENGANALAEGFLFSVAAALIIGETWRTSRNTSKRKDDVDDKLEGLETKVTELTTRVDLLAQKWDDQLQEERQRNDELARILERVVEIGLRGGWAEFQDTPLPLPRVQLTSPRPPSEATEETAADSPPGEGAESKSE
ncbi:hypothetical protein PC9H_001638 [Pleurotus ostreatus]|uniref:OPA3-domain-containing protein n=1 Tax=Pleurotus ostreatus TaxID=5322 RepID=A0A8H7DWD8_PLEOS|nr:uncharacterized protein PC9H_001638 [Pleurotus ostreatus]KAF7441289.1 hypothetical protein PC9H_001638 [Pleurotus ostreatus]KAJ8699183.1 hypothetical protein PTI98_002328 [Pleurotus ostreatus]